MTDDARIRAANPGNAAGGAKLSLKIAGLHEVADQVREITFVAADGRPLPAWEPGAHVSFQVADRVERQYSLCGPLDEPDFWRIGVLRPAESRGGSARVHTAWKTGDVITASAPRNHFRFEPAGGYLFIAGGIGITPLLPMIERARSNNRPWRLVYGGRNRASMAWLDALAALGGDVTIWPEDEVGRPDLKALTEGMPEDNLVYSCGPEGLLNALIALSQGWPKNRLRLERFSPVNPAADRIDHAFTAHLRASDRSIRVEAGESLLDVMAREGIRHPAACREGTCGTCETRVLSGAIDHRDSVLSEEERGEGKWMMACVSRARGAEIELDV